MKNAPAKLGLGFLLVFMVGEPLGQEWSKPGAGRKEYVEDRTTCVQQAQGMALAGDALDKDVDECLRGEGWHHNPSDRSAPMYCAEKEVAISCKPGGTEDMYKRDRAECIDHMMKTVGNSYASPGWWGLGGLIVSAIQTQGNKTNLTRSQLEYMKVCLEGRNWTVEFKGDAKALMEPTGTGSAPHADQPANGMPRPTDAEYVAPQSNKDRGAVGVPITSKYQYTAEQVAKANGCNAPIATMNLAGPGVETFTVMCGTDAPMSIRCDYGQCISVK